jgi:hypothetical protein
VVPGTGLCGYEGDGSTWVPVEEIEIKSIDDVAEESFGTFGAADCYGNGISGSNFDESAIVDIVGDDSSVFPK